MYYCNLRLRVFIAFCSVYRKKRKVNKTVLCFTVKRETKHCFHLQRSTNFGCHSIVAEGDLWLGLVIYSWIYYWESNGGDDFVQRILCRACICAMFKVDVWNFAYFFGQRQTKGVAEACRPIIFFVNCIFSPLFPATSIDWRCVYMNILKKYNVLLFECILRSFRR